MIDVEMLRPTADEMLSGLTAGDAMRKRLLFQAEAVDRLSEAANEMLGSLHATSALRHRILVKAERKQTAWKNLVVPVRSKQVARPALRRAVPALGMAFVLAFMLGIGANYGKDSFLPTGTPSAQHGMNTQAAGTQTSTSDVPQYRPLFAGEGANPPLIGINGRYYRMLNSPVPVPSSLLDGAITDVTAFSDEPSLMSKVGIVSNVVSVGTTVYAIQNVSNKTLCAAEVDGVMRLFQRISYASMGTMDAEFFEDTLDINGMISALELSGVGLITNEVDANDLIYLLSEYALYMGGELSESDQALTIYLQNGLSLQLLVQDDVFGGCGTWACPEFFEEFNAALARAQ